jgi:tetratricopeptide (TPR) repeat protein
VISILLEQSHMAATKPMIDEAMRFHRDGRWNEAEELFRKILASDSECPEALHGLGVLAREAGEKNGSAELLAHAVAARPNSAVYLADLGDVLASQNRMPDAIRCWRQAIDLDPRNSQALFALGEALSTSADPLESVEFLQRGLALRPNHAAGLANLGVALKRSDRSKEALEALGKSVALNPHSVAASKQLAALLQSQGRAEEAAAYSSKATGDDTDPRWRGYTGTAIFPDSPAWKALYMPPPQPPAQSDSPDLMALREAAFRDGLPNYKDLFYAGDQPLPCVRRDVSAAGNTDWLESPKAYPAEFGIYEAISRSGRPLRMLEIGVWTGYSAVTFLKAAMNPALYVGVDPNIVTPDGLARTAETLRLLRAGGIHFEYSLIEGFPWDAAVQNTLAHTGPFDIVRIDGDQSLAGKLIDLELAMLVCADDGYVLADHYLTLDSVRDAVARAMALGMYSEFSVIPTFRGLAILRP